MAVKVELSKELITECINLKIASVKRAMNGAKPQFKLLYEKELAELQTAVNTLT